MILSKQCTKCKEIKPLEEFNRANTKDGRRYQCKVCHHSYQLDPTVRKVYSARYYNKKKATAPELFMWKQAKHRAKYDYNDMEFTIEVSDIVIPEAYPYFKRPFEALDKNWGHSLDRIDSNKGYTKDNIQVISRLANIMKNNATVEQLVQFAQGVLEVHSKEEKLC